VKISSATLVDYNANDRGNYSPDCVKRAISMAFSKYYSEVAKDLRKAQAEVRAETGNDAWEWNMSTVYSRVIKDYGGSEKLQPEEKGITVGEFADTHLGTYLIQSGKTPSRSNHLVCVVDGEVFDTWNSLDQYVVSYYQVEGAHKPKSNIKDQFDSLIGHAQELIYNQAKLRIKKFGLEDELELGDAKSRIRSFAFQITLQLYAINYSDYEPKIQIIYAFSPTTTYDEAIEYIKKITPTRVYDRLYAIRDKLKDLQEAADYVAEDSISTQYLTFYDERERRFYNSLPEWLKQRVTYLSIQAPGNYSDSYKIEFRPLPGDPDDDRVYFEGETSDEIRDRIARYKKTYDREWYEYY
jgi:hypothetical protein